MAYRPPRKARYAVYLAAKSVEAGDYERLRDDS